MPPTVARVIEVVYVMSSRGGDDPCDAPRAVLQYWSKDGHLLAEHDTIFHSPDAAWPLEVERRRAGMAAVEAPAAAADVGAAIAPDHDDHAADLGRCGAAHLPNRLKGNLMSDTCAPLQCTNSAAQPSSAPDELRAAIHAAFMAGVLPGMNDPASTLHPAAQAAAALRAALAELDGHAGSAASRYPRALWDGRPYSVVVQAGAGELMVVFVQQGEDLWDGVWVSTAAPGGGAELLSLMERHAAGELVRDGWVRKAPLPVVPL